MTDEIADAAEFTFRTPDEASALRCSEALSAYGFARVYAYCPIDGDWLVTAIDEGPYPYGKVGERAVDEVGHQAAEAVRAFRAYFIGGGTVALGPPMPPARTGIRVQYENPGSRPPVPLVTIGTPPPMVVLPLAPDRVVAGKPDLSGLDDISWSELEHAYGPADDVRDRIRCLCGVSEEWDETLDDLGNDLLHQGNCYSASAPALSFLARIATSGALPAVNRLAIYLKLQRAASLWGRSILGDAHRAEAEDRAPVAAPHAEAVHRAIGDLMPALLSNWRGEPPAIRFVLAGLSGLYPSDGKRLRSEISSMSDEFAGTQVCEYTSLVSALLSDDEQRVLMLARKIAEWETDLRPIVLEYHNVPAATRAGYVLTEGVLYGVATQGAF